MSSRHALTPEDVLSFKNVDDAQIAPDGTCVAFVVGDSFKTDGKWARSGIWVVETTGGEPRQLTAGPRTDSLPSWSPDGRQLAFLSDRGQEGQRQIYLLPAGGGKATTLTRIEGEIPAPRGLNALQWSPDGRQLAFLLEDSPTAQERHKQENKDDAIEFEQQPKYVRLWTVDVETREVQCVSPDGLQIWEFAWSPDARQFAAVVSDLPYEWSWYHNKLACFALNGPAQTLWQSKRQVTLPVWSPDGEQLGFISSTWSDRGCTAGDVWLIHSSSGEARNLTEGMVASIGWLAWSSAGRELLTIGPRARRHRDPPHPGGRWTAPELVVAASCRGRSVQSAILARRERQPGRGAGRRGKSPRYLDRAPGLRRPRVDPAHPPAPAGRSDRNRRDRGPPLERSRWLGHAGPAHQARVLRAGICVPPWC